MLTDRKIFPDHDYVKNISGICKYTGGKGRIVGYVQYLVYERKAKYFMDLSAGAGTVSLNIDAEHKIINDISVLLTTVYEALSTKNTSVDLVSKIQCSKFCEEEYKNAFNYWRENINRHLDSFSENEIVEAAYYAWLLLQFSRSGDNVKLNKPDHIDFEHAEKLAEFTSFKDRAYIYLNSLTGATVINEDLISVLKYYVKNEAAIPENAVIYIDPPYICTKDNNYNVKFTPDDHKKMLDLADKLPRDKCSVIISAYQSDSYDDLLSRSDFGIWQKTFGKELSVQNGNGKKYVGKSRKKNKEFFYTNFKF